MMAAYLERQQTLHSNYYATTVESLYNGHLWGTMFCLLAFIQRWPLLRGCFVFIWDLGAWCLAVIIGLY